MKEIQPIKVWYNGTQIDVNYLAVRIADDNLTDRAVLGYQLLNVTPEEREEYDPRPSDPYIIIVNVGEHRLEGEEYQNWGTNGLDINLETYQIVAAQLGLILI